MKKRLIFFLPILLVILSFAAHKFYVSIYQINYDASKKRVEITARLFVDDLNFVLEKTYHKKTNLGTPNQSKDEELLLIDYLSNHIFVSINGSKKKLQFVRTELDTNILICYLKINDIPKIGAFEIQNNAFMEQFDTQQNIIQSSIMGEKNSLLFTSDKYKGILK